MSNTPNPNEIDEVMSSVRKLVSRSDRPAEATAEDPTPVEPEGASEKLLLTPALRVDSPEQSDQEEPAPSATQNDNVLILDADKAREIGGHDATIAQLEAAVSQPAEDWQPEETETFNEADWALSAMAATEEPEFFVGADSATATDDASADEDIPSEPDDELAAFLPQEPAIDQDALREMIVQIVREELAGETGERITRNVRKLVRREINLMLAARNLR